MNKKWLTEISLNAELLVVNVMVCASVGKHNLKRIPGEFVAAVVVHGFYCGEHKQCKVFSVGKPNNNRGNTRTQSVEKKPLGQGVVKRAKCVRNIKSVVHGVHVSVSPLVSVHEPVQNVLPGIDNEEGHKQPEKWENELEKHDSCLLRNAEIAPDFPNHKRLVPSLVVRLKKLKTKTCNCLNDMLVEHRPQNLADADAVFGQFFGSVDAIPRKPVVGVTDMVEQRKAPICHYRSKECEMFIGDPRNERLSFVHEHLGPRSRPSRKSVSCTFADIQHVFGLKCNWYSETTIE